MIHKFVANDNKGNVNVLEVTSTGTKLGKVAAPVEDTDAATKKYVDDNIGGGSGSNKFIVTLTPTEADFSGTMDKTGAEITAAYEAGQEIVFNVVGFPGFDHVYIPAAWYSYATGNTICSACATLVDVANDLQIAIFTLDGGSSLYGTDIYTLTPAS